MRDQILGSKNFIHYFVPVFLLVYFFLASIPVISNSSSLIGELPKSDKIKAEIFPFFSFKLYSKIPNGFSFYDVIIDKGETSEHFLIKGNSELNLLQRKRYRSRVSALGSQFEFSDSLSAKDYSNFLIDVESAYLVKISGDYVRAIRDNDYNVEILKKLK